MNELAIKSSINTDLLNVLRNQKTAQKILNYLTTNEVHNLMLANKTIYNIFQDPKTFIYNKYMLKKYKDNYLFFYYHKIKIKKLYQILEVINFSDGIYKSLYKKTDIIVFLYYLAGCVLLLDIFVLMVMIDKSVNHFDDFLPHIPLVIFWVLCVAIILTISILEKIAFNKVKKYFREKNIVKEGDLLEKKILSNISRRLCNQKPISYKPISLTYILCFIPIIYKYFFSTKYSVIFLYVSGLLCIIGFLYDLSKFFYYKYNHKFTKTEIYEAIYENINPNYFSQKLRNILSYYPYWNVSEVRLGFLFYFWLAIFHGVIMLYSFLIGSKLDDSSFGISWRILLIPLYIACAIIVLWGIIYIYSIKQHKSEYKWILVVTIIIIMICTIVNCVFWPNFYTKYKSITRFFPIVIDGIITLTVIVHWFFLYKSKKKYIGEDI